MIVNYYSGLFYLDLYEILKWEYILFEDIWVFFFYLRRRGHQWLLHLSILPLSIFVQTWINLKFVILEWLGSRLHSSFFLTRTKEWLHYLPFFSINHQFTLSIGPLFLGIVRVILDSFTVPIVTHFERFALLFRKILYAAHHEVADSLILNHLSPFSNYRVFGIVIDTSFLIELC